MFGENITAYHLKDLLPGCFGVYLSATINMQSFSLSQTKIFQNQIWGLLSLAWLKLGHQLNNYLKYRRTSVTEWWTKFKYHLIQVTSDEQATMKSYDLFGRIEGKREIASNIYCKVCTPGTMFFMIQCENILSQLFKKYIKRGKKQLTL